MLAPVLEKMVSLRSLDLRRNQIGDEGIKSLAPFLEKIASLTLLDLQGNQISYEGIKSFAPFLEKMFSLRALNLRRNKFDAEVIDSELLLSLKKLVMLGLEIGVNMAERSEALSSLPEELPNLIFLNRKETKNYEVAKKLAEDIVSSNEIKNREEFLRYSAAVKYFLRNDYKGKDLLSSIDYLLKLEDFRAVELPPSLDYTFNIILSIDLLRKSVEYNFA